MPVLDDAMVRGCLLQAWQDSHPGTDSAHEEGGFVLRGEDGSLRVERWPRGVQDEIIVPEHLKGFRNQMPILATFHTHPNPTPGYQQEPSLTDVRAVRDDIDLHHPNFEGEYVVSKDLVYRILKDGDVEVVGETSKVFHFQS